MLPKSRYQSDRIRSIIHLHYEKYSKEFHVLRCLRGIIGPISVIKSFTKQHLDRVVNGGPLTLEFDQSVFSNDETIEKLGMLVKTYIALGGHQLQLNTVSRETLLHARKHPEQHKNLIVRVWGWSGYFVELDECYQNHVINRIEFGL